MKIINFLKLIIALALPLVAGVVGSAFTVSVITGWYVGLVKPVLNPPSWVFGPVWTVLYLLMGVALWLVWVDMAAAPVARQRALILFTVQLVLNMLWSIIFFGLQSPGWALVDIILLWLAIFVTIITFIKVSKMAAWLLLPYILWVSFAIYLNFSIWILN